MMKFRGYKNCIYIHHRLSCDDKLFVFWIELSEGCCRKIIGYLCQGPIQAGEYWLKGRPPRHARSLQENIHNLTFYFRSPGPESRNSLPGKLVPKLFPLFHYALPLLLCFPRFNPCESLPISPARFLHLIQYSKSPFSINAKLGWCKSTLKGMKSALGAIKIFFFF